MNHEPDTTKKFRHPVLGEIVGYDNIAEFDAAVAAHNETTADDPPFAGDDPAWWAARGLEMPSLFDDEEDE